MLSTADHCASKITVPVKKCINYSSKAHQTDFHNVFVILIQKF